jgi:hypothetical protein
MVMIKLAPKEDAKCVKNCSMFLKLANTVSNVPEKYQNDKYSYPYILCKNDNYINM